MWSRSSVAPAVRRTSGCGAPLDGGCSRPLHAWQHTIPHLRHAIAARCGASPAHSWHHTMPRSRVATTVVPPSLAAENSRSTRLCGARDLNSGCRRSEQATHTTWLHSAHATLAKRGAPSHSRQYCCHTGVLADVVACVLAGVVACVLVAAVSKVGLGKSDNVSGAKKDAKREKGCVSAGTSTIAVGGRVMVHGAELGANLGAEPANGKARSAGAGEAEREAEREEGREGDPEREGHSDVSGDDDRDDLGDAGGVGDDDNDSDDRAKDSGKADCGVGDDCGDDDDDDDDSTDNGSDGSDSGDGGDRDNWASNRFSRNEAQTEVLATAGASVGPRNASSEDASNGRAGGGSGAAKARRRMVDRERERVTGVGLGLPSPLPCRFSSTSLPRSGVPLLLLIPPLCSGRVFPAEAAAAAAATAAAVAIANRRFLSSSSASLRSRARRFSSRFSSSGLR